jgi:hypothetical protein
MGDPAPAVVDSHVNAEAFRRADGIFAKAPFARDRDAAWCGYPEHIDEHDVAIIVFSGVVETLGQRAGPAGSIYYAAGEPHGLRNVGSEPARYLVFEFHANA